MSALDTLHQKLSEPFTKEYNQKKLGSTDLYLKRMSPGERKCPTHCQNLLS